MSSKNSDMDKLPAAYKKLQKNNPDLGFEEEVSESTLMQILGWAYEKSLDPSVPGLDSAYDLANNYLKKDGSKVDQINSLIRWQNTKAGTSGFISGLGGIITLPVFMPANISSVIYVQVRMIAAIAIMGGHDPKDDRVKTLVYACLCGNAAKDILKQAGIELGKKLTISVIKNISREVVVKINQKIGFRLLTKFGEKGLINLGKAVPFVGGVIGGTLDVLATNTIGNVARDTFSS